jgi:hypothetical protein
LKVPFNTRRRRAISGIIGAVFLFTMLFTVGSEYFIFINNANAVETQSLVARGNALAARLQEDVQVSTALNSTGYVQFYLNNTGGAALNVTSLMVLSSSGAILECDGIGTPQGQGCINTAPVMPLVANVGEGVPSKGYEVTDYHYVSGTVILELVTSSGNVFSATYPATGVALASQALSSGAIGDLYLSFNSYTYYLLTDSGCPTGSGYSTYCLETNSPNSGPAFAMSHSLTGNNFAFSITITDLNHQQADVVLDQYTLIYLNNFYGNSHQNNIPWYIANTGPASGQKIPIYTYYTPVVLTYDNPTTVYFISSSCITAASGPNGGNCAAFSPQGNSYSEGSVATVNILSNGWELAHGSYSIPSLTYSEANYGQNTPYVSTLFY